MASAKEKFIETVKKRRRLRESLNKAFDDLFNSAGIIGLSKAKKKECVESLTQFLVFEKDYDNVHVHWSS